MSIFIGDLHLREEEPFYSSAKYVLDYLVNYIRDPLKEIAGFDKYVKQTFIFTGDFFHKANPTIKELKTAREFFEKVKQAGSEVVIIAGNHEYNGLKDCFVEDIFKDTDITFVDECKWLELEDCNLFCMPYISNYRLKKYGFKDLQSYYEQRYNDLNTDWTRPQTYTSSCNFLVYHFEDETQFNGVDLSFVDSLLCRIGGHIHITSKNYIGTPYVTRKDESGQKCKLLILTQDAELQPIYLPELIKYVDIEFNELESMRFNSKIKYILNVKNVPSVDMLKEFLKDKNNLYLADCESMFSEERNPSNESENSNEQKSLKDYLLSYIEENKLNKTLGEYCLKLLN